MMLYDDNKTWIISIDYSEDIYPLYVRCAPGTLDCLDPRKCPRADPSSTPGVSKNWSWKQKMKTETDTRFHRSDFTPRHQQYHHWVQRWTQTALTWNDETTFVEIRRFYRLKPSQVRELLKAGQEVTLEKKLSNLFLWDSLLAFLNIPKMIEKNLKKQLHIRKASSARSFCSPSHWPHVISCHRAPALVIFKR